MHLYRIVAQALWQNRVPYHGDRQAAHDDAKGFRNMGRWDEAEDRIELVDIEVNKENVLSMLNGSQAPAEVLKTWMLTNRGGLKEVPNGD